MKLTKVTLGSQVVIEFITMHNDNPQVTTYRDEHQPAGTFTAAFGALIPDVVRLIEAGKTYGSELTPYQISVSREEDGRRGVVITARKKVKAGMVSLNTPHQRESLSPEEKGAKFMPSDMLARIETVLAEAVLYYNGNHEKQEELGHGDGEPAGYAQAEIPGTPEPKPVKAKKKRPKAGPQIVN